MLSDRDRAVLDIERQFWRSAGAKESAVRDLGLTWIRYYQILNSLTGSADAWEYAPTALAQVERARGRRRQGRVA